MAVKGHVENNREREGSEPAKGKADRRPKVFVVAFVGGSEDRVHGLHKGVSEDDGDEDKHGRGIVVREATLGAITSDEKMGKIKMERGEEVDSEEEAGMPEEIPHCREADGEVQRRMTPEKDEKGSDALERHAGGENECYPAHIMSKLEDGEPDGSVQEFTYKGEQAVPVMFVEGTKERGDGEIPGVKEDPDEGEVDRWMESRVVKKHQDTPADKSGEDREDEL